MSRGIPVVKEWIIRTQSDTFEPTVWRVLAPTKRLAVLNLRMGDVGTYASILSGPSVCRTPRRNVYSVERA